MELIVYIFLRYYYLVSYYFIVNIGMFLELLCGKCVMWGFIK